MTGGGCKSGLRVRGKETKEYAKVGWDMLSGTQALSILYTPAALYFFPIPPSSPRNFRLLTRSSLFALPSSPSVSSSTKGSALPTPFPTDTKGENQHGKKKKKGKYFFSTQNPNHALNLPHPRLGKHFLAEPPTTLAGADAHGEPLLRGEGEGFGEARGEVLGRGCVET